MNRCVLQSAFTLRPGDSFHTLLARIHSSRAGASILESIMPTTAATRTETRRGHTSSVVHLDGWGIVRINLYQVRTATFCLLSTIDEATGANLEFFNFSKCHTKDHNDVRFTRSWTPGRTRVPKT